jgi:hypothetical protein
MDSPTKFIDFKDNIITFYKDEVSECVKSVDYPVCIVSFVGEARFGKSSLINCFITFLLKKNSIIFKTSGSNKHCTIGIDMFIVKREEECFGYLLLDCQGINHGNSSNDCKLMLLAYELSNVIIYNDKKLNNSTLKGLESMNLFERYIPNIYENTNRPLLIFRIRDYDMDDKIEDVLNDLLELQDDQYDTIRRTINKLYKSVNAFSTSPLTKEEKKTLSNHEYDIVLLSLDNEFAKFCEDIEKTVLMTKPIILTKEHIDTIDGTIDKMNKDKKIDYKLLDISSLNLHKDLLEFMSGLDKKLFEKLPCNVGSQEYHDKVEVILKLLNEQINKFDLLFSKCDTTITEQYKEKLIKQKIIMECWLNDNITKAKLSCNHYFDEIIRTYNFSDFTTKCIDLTDDIIKIICDDIQIKLEKDISRYHSTTKKNFGINIIHKLRSNLLIIYLEHNRNIADNTKSAQNILKDVLVIEDIINYDNIDIQVKFENQKFIKDTLDKINVSKPTITDEKFFTFNLEYGYTTFGLEFGGWKINMINKKYCKIDDVTYNKYYVDEVNKFFNGTAVLEFYDVLVRRKISEYICKHAMYENCTITNNIVGNNPNITFLRHIYISTHEYNIGCIASKIPAMIIHLSDEICETFNIFRVNNCPYLHIENEYEYKFNKFFTKIDEKFTYDNIIKKNITVANSGTFTGGTLNKYSNVYTCSIVNSSLSYFCRKVSKYYKKLKEQFEEEQFNKFIGLSETI